MSENDVCMVYDDHGNAFHYFDYTPEALEAEALKLRRERGEVSTVTVGLSPFITDRRTA
jgi:hypothetical protein